PRSDFQDLVLFRGLEACKRHEIMKMTMPDRAAGAIRTVPCAPGWPPHCASPQPVPSTAGLTRRNMGSPRPRSAWPSPVDAADDRIDARDRGYHVGDHGAFAHHRDRLEMMERRIAEVDAVRPGPALADHMSAELAAGRLDRHVRLAGRHPEPLGQELEMV